MLADHGGDERILEQQSTVRKTNARVIKEPSTAAMASSSKICAGVVTSSFRRRTAITITFGPGMNLQEVLTISCEFLRRPSVLIDSRCGAPRQSAAGAEEMKHSGTP